MARLGTVRCPNCGANVRLEVGAEWVTCGYCKTEAYVQRPKAPPPPPRAVAVVVVPAASSGPWGPLIAVAALVLVGGGIAFAALYESSTLEDVSIQSPAMLFDVNRDGAKDALIAGLVTGQTAIHVRALDARTGSTLWRSDDLADIRKASKFALNEDAVLMIHEAQMIGLDARTGKQRFTQTLPERLENACEDENHFYLELADHNCFEVNPRTGALTALPSAAATGDSLATGCTPAWGEKWQMHGQFVRKASWDGATDEHIHPSVRLQYGREPTMLLVGERKQGSRVPMLAGVRGGVVWRTILPAKNPLEAAEGAPSGSTLTTDRAYATYSYADGGGFALVGVAMNDGSRLWETRVPRKGDPGGLTLSADDNHVFVFASGAMHGVSASNGQLLWSVGWGLGH